MLVSKGLNSEKSKKESEKIIHGYEILEDFHVKSGGTCEWTFAKKDGKDYFIKRLISNKHPGNYDPEIYSKEDWEKKVHNFFEWYNYRVEFKNRMSKIISGNIIGIKDIFIDNNISYIVTDKVDAYDLPFKKVKDCPMQQKELLMRVLAHEFSLLADAKIIYCDIKPDNLILKKTEGSNFTIKLIDFDGSFLLDKKDPSGSLNYDPTYASPEITLKGEFEEDADITEKSDIFSLGLIYHYILTGDLPEYDGDSAAVTLLNEEEVKCNPNTGRYRELIEKMLSLDAKDRPGAKEIFEFLTKNRVIKEKKITKCVNCGFEVSAGTTICPQCGKNPFKIENNNKTEDKNDKSKSGLVMSPDMKEIWKQAGDL